MKLSRKAVALLKGKNFAYLATVNKDGSPQVTPVWVDTDGKNVLINTAVGRVKERNMARDPRVAVSVFDFADQYSGVSIRGRVAKRFTGKRADDDIDSLSYKYTGNKRFQGRIPGQERVTLIIQPTRVSEQ